MRTLLFLIVVSGSMFAATASAVLLDAKVTNRKSKDSDIVCLLFTSQIGFPMDPTKADFLVVATPNSDGSALCEFNEVPSGKFAVSVLEDLNGNRKMDVAAFGIPKEPWGVSKNVRAQKYGPPKFADAMVDVQHASHLEIKLNRP